MGGNGAFYDIVDGVMSSLGGKGVFQNYHVAAENDQFQKSMQKWLEDGDESNFPFQLPYQSSVPSIPETMTFINLSANPTGDRKRERRPQRDGR